MCCMIPFQKRPIHRDRKQTGTSLVVPWARICLSTEEMGLIPGPGRFHMLQGN